MKRIVASLLIAFLLVAVIPQAYAHDSAAEHWQDMSLALFGDTNFITGKPEKVRNAVWALRYASQLCIDQFGADGGKAQLQRLKDVGIKGAPELISDIALYPLHNDHRTYTHLGWEYDYSSFNDDRNPAWSTGTWPSRQALLRSTVEQVFNFNGMPQWLDGIAGYNEQCESFTKLLYYIHILGDQIEYNSKTYAEGKHEVMPLAATREKSIISELIACLPILFPEQNYSQLQKELETINTNVVSLLNKPEALGTEEGFAHYHENAEKVLEVLKKYLPGLLKEEEFFKNVFY